MQIISARKLRVRCKSLYCNFLVVQAPCANVRESESEPRFLTLPQFAKLCEELPPQLNIAGRFAVLPRLGSG